MENLRYVVVAVLVVISIISVIFCIVRGRGASRRMLVSFACLLCVVAMICFGGQAILTCFGMGWRCAPFNTMLLIGSILFVVTLCFGMYELSVITNIDSIVVRCGLVSMSLLVIITLLSLFFYFHLSSWQDGLTIYNDRTIVYANDQHGGSCSWRYYDHINSLVHGEEITTIHGWHGNPPRF